MSRDPRRTGSRYITVLIPANSAGDGPKSHCTAVTQRDVMAISIHKTKTRMLLLLILDAASHALHTHLAAI